MSVKDYKLALTTAGQALMAKIQAGDGKVPLDITRVVISSDTSGDPLNMAVGNVIISLPMDIISREIIDGVRTVIKVKATNIGNPLSNPVVPPVTKGFVLSRIFFFANDPDKGEIIYRVSQFSQPNYVPAVTEAPWTYEPTFNIVTGNASEVNITVNPEGLVTLAQLYTIINSLDMGYFPGDSALTQHMINPFTHMNIIADGGEELLLEEHESDPDTHDNLVIDGNYILQEE